MPLPVVATLLQAVHERIRDVVYDLVSTNRYNIFGEAAHCRLMQPEWKDRFLM
jgi:predicted DCC family thiol-disulfide oxidoreductase YuxK